MAEIIDPSFTLISSPNPIQLVNRFILHLNEYHNNYTTVDIFNESFNIEFNVEKNDNDEIIIGNDSHHLEWIKNKLNLLTSNREWFSILISTDTYQPYKNTDNTIIEVHSYIIFYDYDASLYRLNKVSANKHYDMLVNAKNSVLYDYMVLKGINDTVCLWDKI